MIFFAERVDVFGQVDLPRVGFLAAHELEGRIAVVIGRAAVFPIVVVIGDEVAVDARLVQDLGEGVVEGFERAPAAVQEGQPARHHVASRRHAFKGASREKGPRQLSDGVESAT